MDLFTLCFMYIFANSFTHRVSSNTTTNPSNKNVFTLNLVTDGDGRGLGLTFVGGSF